MSSLRRLAQTNHASTLPDSPQKKSIGMGTQTPSRLSLGAVRGSPAQNGHGANGINGAAEPRLPLLPVTPRSRAQIKYAASPASTPSISSSVPFDWDAARNHKPPPYGGTPLARLKKAAASAVSGTPGKNGSKKVVRKKGIVERMTALPTRIWDEIAMFPQNVPMPPPKTAAWMIGGLLHFVNLIVRISQGRRTPSSDFDWENADWKKAYRGSENMYHGGENPYRESEPWFDWTTPVVLALFGISLGNAVLMFTRIRLYHMHHQRDPVASPRASFVPVALDSSPLQPPPVSTRLRAGAWRAFVGFWRFLLHLKPSRTTPPTGGPSRVQQLDVWAPGETELALFSIYSPAHALLWMAMTGTNWILMAIIMVSVGAQLQIMTRSFEALIKDKGILAAEVMHEYDEKFVNPRVNPIRKDVATMTHQSEIVNVWEE